MADVEMVKTIAKNCFTNAVEALSIIEVLEAANGNGVMKSLNDAKAGRAAAHKCAAFSNVFTDEGRDLFDRRDSTYSQLIPNNGNTRCRMAPTQTRTTSNLRRLANRLSFTKLSITQKQSAPTMQMMRTPISTEIMILILR